MKSWQLQLVFYVNFVMLFISSQLMAGSEHSKMQDTTKQSINYSRVKPQVTFNSVTELKVNQPDEKIAYGNQALQYGLLWRAQNTPKPLVVLVHGGCWLNAFGVEHSFPMATALSQAGHSVWSLEYRRTGDAGGGWPGSFSDIKLALNQLSLLKEHGVNIDEVILMGHSAGGHLALLAANELPDIKFKQVIGLAAITDISRYALGENSCQQATTGFMGGLPHEVPNAYQAANLIYQKLGPEVILLQGDADEIVPVIQSQLHEVSAEIVTDAGHFDWIHPGSPAFNKLKAVMGHQSTDE